MKSLFPAILGLLLLTAAPADARPMRVLRAAGGVVLPPPTSGTIFATATFEAGQKDPEGYGGIDPGCNGCGTISIDSQSGPLGSSPPAFRMSTSAADGETNLIVPDGPGTYGGANRGPSGVMPTGTYTVNIRDSVNNSTGVITINVVGGGKRFWRGRGYSDGASANQLQSLIQYVPLAKGDQLVMRAGSVWNPDSAQWLVKPPVATWPASFIQSLDPAQRITVTCETHDTSVDANGWPNYNHPCKMGRFTIDGGKSGSPGVDANVGITFDYMQFYSASIYAFSFLDYRYPTAYGVSVLHSKFTNPVFKQSQYAAGVGPCYPDSGLPHYYAAAGCDAVTSAVTGALMRAGYFSSNRVEGLGDGIHGSGIGATPLIIDGNYIHAMTGDSIQLSGANIEVTNNFVTDQYYVSLGIHGDPVQHLGIVGVSNTTYDHFVVSDNAFFRGDGLTTRENSNNGSDFQSCIFFSDTTPNVGNHLTGVVMERNVCGTTGDEAPSLNDATNPIVRFNTMTTDKGGTYTNGLVAALKLNGSSTGGTITDNAFGAIIIASGANSGAVFTPAANNQGITNSTTSYNTAFVAYNRAPKNWNEVCVGRTPRRGVAVASGGMMNPDGTYLGKYFPTKNGDNDGCGEVNDGTVFVP